jgi:hypothetical protein
LRLEALMPGVQVRSEEADHHMALRLTSGDRHISASLARRDGRWMLDYTTTGSVHTVNLVAGKAPWSTALRRALADCEQVLASRRPDPKLIV